MSIESSKQGFTGIHDHVQEHIRSLTRLEKIEGIEIASLIRMTANLYDVLREQRIGNSSLSGPRWGLLIRLMAEEARGNPEVTPTYLSRCQSVSKNTISALIGGLEAQGLVSRRLNPEDKRNFYIRISPAGKELVHQNAPKHARYLNELAGNLSTAEQTQLVELLARLYNSILEHAKTAEVS